MGSGSPSTVSNWNPQQQNLAHTLAPVLQNQVGQGVSPYQGQLVAPVQDGSQIQSQIASYNPTQFQAGQQQAINQGLSGQSAYNLDPQTTANYFQQAVVNPSMRAYSQTTAPAINEGFAAQGGTFSTARGIAQEKALSNLQDTNAASLASTQQSNQALQAQLAQSAANNQLQSVGLAQQYANAPLYSAAAMSQALQPFQQQAQAQDTAAYQQWQQSQAYNNPYLQQIMGYLGQSSQSAYQQPNYTGQYIGAGTGIAGAVIGGYFGGPAGAAQGAGTGYAVGNGAYNLGTNGIQGLNPYAAQG